jgi:hypothetical protein
MRESKEKDNSAAALMDSAPAIDVASRIRTSGELMGNLGLSQSGELDHAGR